MKFFKSLFVGTAVLAATVLGGCFLNDGGSSEKEPAHLVIGMKVKDVDDLAKQGLGKSSAIKLKKLVITLTSSVGSDAVIRDTIVADTSDEFVSGSGDDQQVLRNYAVKPLRNWTVQVKTLDVNDSIIHASSSLASNIKVGELRQVTLNLTSKFVVYAARFILPDSIGSSDTNVTQKQKLYINRFVMVVDGDTVRDTSSSPGFYSPADTHFVVWDYVRADTVHTLELYVFADSLGNWDPTRPIYGDTIQITSTDTTYTPTLPYTGPGSPNDPNYNPANPGGAQAGLTINIGAVGLVNIAPKLPTNPLPKRKD